MHKLTLNKYVKTHDWADCCALPGRRYNWTIIIKILAWITKCLPWLLHPEIPGECSNVVFLQAN